MAKTSCRAAFGRQGDTSTAAAAAAARNWSAKGCNYTSLRNNLSKERAEKLVYVEASMAARSDNADYCRLA